MRRFTRACIPLIVLSAAVCMAGPAPTTRPAAPKEGGVLLLPFSTPPDQQRLGSGVQQNLVADLAAYVRGRLLAPSDEPPANDAAAALDVARRRHAAVVIFGAVRVSEPALRLTGQVVDVASGKVLGGLKSTGDLSHIFDVEDAFAKQVIGALRPKELTPKSLAVLWNNAPRVSADVSQAPSYVLPSPGLHCELRSTCYSGSVYLPAGAVPIYNAPAPLYGPPYSSVAPAYPDSVYHPFANNNTDLFVFVTVRHRR